MRKKILAPLLDLASSGETDGGPANNEDVRGSKCAHDVEQKTKCPRQRVLGSQGCLGAQRGPFGEGGCELTTEERTGLTEQRQ